MIYKLLAALSFAVFIAAVLYYVYNELRHRHWLRTIFSGQDDQLFVTQQSRFRTLLSEKLTRSGLREKELVGVGAMGITAAASLIGLLFVVELNLGTRIGVILVALAIAVLTPLLYVQEQIAARIRRIDDDLAVFLDLVIIILEGGGGLNNAIDEVTLQAKHILNADLLEESGRLKQELTTYSSDVAYANLVARTGSEEIASLVGFLKLSDETGIGVKTVFENQSGEIKERDMLEIEKRATLLNIYMTLVVFFFILPALIAMVGIPMAADALMPGF
jgi:tight adherence protein C